MWFALKIILYLLAAGGILAWCAYSLRKSRDLLGKYLHSLPAKEVQELADRADNSYEQLAYLSGKCGQTYESAVFYPAHPDRIADCFQRLSLVLDEPLPAGVASHIATVYRAMEDETLVAYTLNGRYEGEDVTLIVTVRSRKESLSGTYLLDPATGKLTADDWVQNPVITFFCAARGLVGRIRS